MTSYSTPGMSRPFILLTCEQRDFSILVSLGLQKSLGYIYFFLLEIINFCLFVCFMGFKKAVVLISDTVLLWKASEEIGLIFTAWNSCCRKL